VRNYGDQFRGDVTLDSDDNIYVVSSTISTNFPTPNGFQTSHRGGTYDAVIARLNPTVSALTWASYFGGSGMDAAYSIQLNAAREIYIGGGTGSNNLAPTAGAASPAAQGGIDGFILRLTPTGFTFCSSTTKAACMRSVKPVASCHALAT
jgi:hypothetical protein